MAKSGPIHKVALLISVGLLFLSVVGTVYAGSIFHTDPPPLITSASSEYTVLRKELGGYPNYGITDGRADVLYSTESDQWIFDLSQIALTHPVQSVEVRMALVLDDHYVRPPADYVGRILLNGEPLFTGNFSTDLGLSHGAPYGARFGNWKLVTFQINQLAPSLYTIQIMNDTSGAVYGDWLAIDYIELHLRAFVPVQIDIKPDSFPNSINPREKGVIPVAVLTTGDFNARDIDPAQVHFGPEGFEAAARHSALTDVDGDGDLDLLLHFGAQDIRNTCVTTFLSLRGSTFSGQSILGSNPVRIVGCK